MLNISYFGFARPAVIVAVCLAASHMLSPTSAVADVAAGKAAYTAGDYEKAQQEFTGPANSGDPEAQYWMGRLLDEGYLGRKDAKGAFGWFKKAAGQGHAEAQRIVGAFYEIGKVVSRSYRNAERWYEQAADGGNAKAMRNLGTLYLDGKGVGSDQKKAISLFEKSAALGNAKAMRNLGYIYYFGGVVDRDLKKAAAPSNTIRGSNRRNSVWLGATPTRRALRKSPIPPQTTKFNA